MAQTQAQVELLAKEAEEAAFFKLDKHDPAPQPNERGMWVKANSPWVEKIESYDCWHFHKWNSQMPSLKAYKSILGGWQEEKVRCRAPRG